MIIVRIGNVEDQVDTVAFVNAANSHLRPGSGVCGAIYKAAGFDRLNDEVTTHYPNGCPTGQSVVTTAGNLGDDAKIIHAVGPKYAEYTPDDAKWLLASTYFSIFSHCKRLGIKSVAVPAISTGVYGYPMPEAAEVAVAAARYAEFLYPELQIVFVVWPDKGKAFQAAVDQTSSIQAVVSIGLSPSSSFVPANRG